MLDKLEFMIALAREKHFGRAAESCGVAQPTLSQGIQQLEEMLNVPLVKRSSRFLGFTPEGERVLVWARRLVGDAQAMRKEILGMQQGQGAQLRIAAMPAAMPLVASLTAPFQLRNPTVRFTLLTRTSDEIMSLLHEREIDAGVRYMSSAPSGDVDEVPLYEERYLLLTTAGGRYGDATEIAWSELAALPLCLFAPSLQQRRIIDEALRRRGVEVRPAIETDSILALTTHVRTGRWVSVVSSLVGDAIDLSGSLRVVPIVDPEVVSSIGLVVSKRFPLQPAMAALMAEARRGFTYEPASQLDGQTGN
ncbi:MAG: LysR family transcriptional regulator [Hyphomicrobium sp.]|nr:LysR family transcriptional regulator [Hyphomicrobium sp.]MBN9266643.1 LysR family transcriptional regulator [Hyphomicrobium sp.]MBN9277485.1 LysR family transcriptional regulator [Hyphomicrobium sp.]